MPRRKARTNPVEVIFVSIVEPDGSERVVSCNSLNKCNTVITVEAQRAAPLTYFTIVGDDDGKPVRIGRWVVGLNGKLRPAQSISKAMRERTTQLARR